MANPHRDTRRWRIMADPTETTESEPCCSFGWRGLGYSVAAEISTAPSAGEILTPPVAAFGKTWVEGGLGIWWLWFGSAIGPSCDRDKEGGGED